jgi:signal transduction histidine kinase
MERMEPWLEHFAHAAFQRSSDTAHDLKTPLNVAVLNLELLRMRVRKLASGEEDEKIADYAKSIELELRRMARIFDAFFILSTPPKSEEVPALIDIQGICTDEGATAGYQLAIDGPIRVVAHESRIRQALKLFFDGASKVLRPESRGASITRDAKLRVEIHGAPLAEDFEVSKIFKFYYTDPLGNPDLSLAAARLIVETYGGELNAEEERDKVSLRLSLPLGEQ